MCCMDRDHHLILNAAGLFINALGLIVIILPLQLKDTAERILAVDRAAAMVEEMLKQGQSLQPPSSTFHPALSNGVKVGMHCIAIFCLS
jgi:hypothetical protein